MDSRITALYEAHARLGARFVDFAGWRMPVQYAGVVAEHMAVRTACGLFDVSHMGEIEVSGERALEAVQHIITNDIRRITDGQCQYTLLCTDDGGVVDDCIVYRVSADNFLFCTNAVNTDSVFTWLLERVGGEDGVDVIDRSGEYAQIAIQGPASLEVFKIAFGIDAAAIKPFRFIKTAIAGVEAIVSRTGYTGEDGLEIYIDPHVAVTVWDALMAAGSGHGIEPVGLGARDTLRLEMGYPLYGFEISEKYGPIEAGLKRFVALGAEGFIGSSALARRVEEPGRALLAGIEVEGAGVPRSGYELCSGKEVVGHVTSGTFSPVLKRGIAMAYIKREFKEPGTSLKVKIRKRLVPCRVAATPFYRRERG